MANRLKSALAGAMLAAFVVAAPAQATSADAASQLSLKNAPVANAPVGARIGAKRSKRESKALLAGVPLAAVIAGAAVVTVGVVAIADSGNSSSP